MDEAVEWARRVPFEALARIYPGEYGAEGEIEIRQLVELERLTHRVSGDTISVRAVTHSPATSAFQALPGRMS
jgi:hypothetical protein